MPAKKGGGKVTVKGDLLLDVTLNTAKTADAQIQKLQKELNAASQILGAKEKDTYNVDAAIKDLTQARRLLRLRAKSTLGVIEGTKDFDKLSKPVQDAVLKDQKRLRDALASLNSALNKAKRGVTDIGDEQLAAKLNKAIAEASPSLDKLKVSTDKLTRATDGVVRERAKQADQLKQQRETEKREQQKAVLAKRQQAQAAKEAAVQRLTGAGVEQLGTDQIRSLDRIQQAAVKEALRGRVGIAELRQSLAEQFKGSQREIDNSSRAVDRARVGLEKFNQIQSQILRTNEQLRRSEKAVRAEEAAAATQAKLDAAARLEAHKVQQETVRGLAKGRTIEDDRRKSEAAKRKAFDAAELAAEQAKQKQINDLWKAQDKRNAESREKESARVKQESDRQIKNYEAYLDQRLKAQKEAVAKANSLAKQEQARQQQLFKEQLSLQQKRAVAQDVLRGYGVQSLGDLEFKQIRREDLGALQTYAKALANTTEAQIRRARQAKASSKDIDKLTAAYQRQVNIVRQLEARYRALHSPLQQVNLLFRQFFRFAIGYGALYQLLGGIKALVGGVVDLDEALKSIQAITASTDADMLRLEATIKRVATTTKFTTNEIAAATQVLGQAGVTAQELPKALQATADFAAATNSNLEIAADLLTTTRNVFKELDENTLADQLTKAINISKLTAQDLKTILSLASQTASAYNLTSEQFLAAVTTLRNAGIKASTVATGLRQGLIEIFSPDSNTINVLKQRYDQLGEQLTEEAIKQRFFGFTQADNPLTQALSELKRLGFAGEAQKEFQRAFDVRAANAIKALIVNYDELAKAEAKITFGLSAAEAAETQMESLRNSLSNLGAAFTVLGDAVLGDAVEGFEGFVDSVTEAIQALNDLDIQLKKQGKSGLSTALLPTLLGGAAGAFFGKGIKQKFAFGALGAGAGGAFGLAPAATEDTAAAAGSAFGGGILALILAALGIRDAKTIKNIATAKGQQNLFGDLDLNNSALRTFISGNFTGKGAGLSKLIGKVGGARIVALIPYIGPVLSFLATLGTLISVVYSFFSEGGTEFQQAENRVQGTLAQLDKIRAERDKALRRVEEFDVDAAKVGGAAGKTAETIVRLQRQFEDYRTAVARTFGDLTENEAEALQEILDRYADTNLAERTGEGGLAQQIKTLTDTDKSIAQIDREAFDLSENNKNLVGGVDEMLGGINRLMEDTYERIDEALSQGKEVSKRDKAIAALLNSSEEIRDAVLGYSDVHAEAIIGYIEKFAKGLRDIDKKLIEEDEKLNASAVKKATRASIRAQLEKAIRSKREEELVNLDLRLQSLTNRLAALNDVTIESIKVIEDEIDDTIKEIEEEQAKRKQQKGRRRGGAGTRPGELSFGNQLKAALLAQKDVLNERKTDLIAAQKKATDATISGAVAAIENFADIIKTDAGRATFEEAIQGADRGKVKAAIEQMAAVPNGFRNFIEKVKAAEVDTTDLKNPQLPEDLAAIVKFLVDVTSRTNAATQGAEKIAQFRGLLPNPSDVALIERLNREIERTTSRRGSREGINQLLSLTQDNPIIQRRDALIREQAKEIRKTIDEMNKIAPEGEKSILDEEVATKFTELQIRLNKQYAELNDIDQEAVDLIQKIKEEQENYVLERRKQLAEFRIKTADLDIGLAGETGNIQLFENAINKIDAANDELLEVFKKQLIRDGIEYGSALYKEAVAEQERQLRDLRTNTDEFIKYLELLTSGVREQADIVRNRPITLGAEQDAISAAFGTAGNARRFQEAANQFSAAMLDAYAIGTEISQLRSASEQQTGTELAKSQREIARLENQLTELNQVTASATMTMAENSDEAERRAQAELAQLTNLQTLTEALQDSNFAFSNFAENLQDTVLGTLENLGNALTDFLIEGGSFQQMLSNILSQLGRELVNQAIQGIITEVGATLTAKLASALPQLAGGGLASAAASAAGKATEAATGAAEATATAAAVGTAVTTAIAPASIQLGAAAFSLQTSAAALTTAAGALSSAAALSGAGGGIGSLFGGKKGGMVYSSGIGGYAEGGVISGPGTGTSDSIPAVHLNDKDSELIAVSNGEAILNAKAVDFLGENFINELNRRAIQGFASGAVLDRNKTLNAGAKPITATAQVTPVENNNQTTVINAIDSSSVVAAAMETPSGDKVFINWMRANKSKIQRILQ